MAGTHCRVILKPDGLGQSDSAELARRLGLAVEAQKQLAAQSPHVLQFVGQLKENEHAFFVEHEPAAAVLHSQELFDLNPPATLDQKELMRIAGALFHALKVAHGTESGPPTIHGGLGPAVVLRTPDGIDKITDFGFAPAICAALSVESYLNLATNSCGDTVTPTSSPHTQGTGVWEVLASDEFERDDRICSFVDPDKYTTEIFDAFEAGSDIIAAGFLLHLIAEHRHPYLDPEAHRDVGMAEFMAMTRYSGARRKDLRESDDPGIKMWCELVAKALNRLPQDRPSASELAESIGQYVKPPDAGELLGRRLDQILKRLAGGVPEEIDWQDVRREVGPIVDCEDAGPEVAKRATALYRRADANILVVRVVEFLKSDKWTEAQEPLDKVLAIEGLPTELTEKAHTLEQTFKRYQAADDELRDIQTQTQDTPSTGLADPAAAMSMLKSLQDRADKLPADESLPPLLRAHKAEMRQELTAKLAEVETELQRRQAAIEAARAKAEQYLGLLQSALDSEQWEKLQGLLDEPPEIEPWPDEVRSRIADIQHRLEEHIAEQKRLAAIKEDHEAADAWIDQVRAAVKAEDWAGAEKLLADKPELTHWPDQVPAEAEKLRAQVRQARKQQADFEKARLWCAEMEKAIADQQWHVAFEKHNQRPELDHWPKEVLEKEARFKEQLDNKRDEIERDRRLTEEQHTKARAWLDEARTAADQQQWGQSLDILSNKPAIERWPEGLLADSEKLAETCRTGLSEEIDHGLRKRSITVKSLAQRFVQTLVNDQFKPFLHVDLVETTVQSEEFVLDNPSADGRAEIIVRLRDPSGILHDSNVNTPFDFQLESKVPQICDDDGSLRQLITDHLTESLNSLQTTRVADLIAPLVNGVFPKAKIDVKIDKLFEHVSASVDLLGAKSADTTLEIEIAWDPATLTWRYADGPSFTSRAWQIATKAARKNLGPKLIQKSKALQRYKSVMAVDVVSKAPADPSVLSQALTLDVQLALRPGGDGESLSLHRLSITCPQAGKVSLDNVDLAPAEASLQKVVATAQNASREAVTTNLQAQIKAKSPKVKLAFHPHRIADPVDEVRFELRARGHDPLTLQATWDIDSFAYRLAKGSNGELEKYLELPVKGGVPPLPVAIAGIVLAVVVILFLVIPKGEERLPVEAAEYLAGLESAFDAGQWEELRKLFEAPPEIKPAPQEILSQIAVIRRRYEEHNDSEGAKAWINGVQTTVAAEKWDEAKKLLDAEPKLTYWPKEVLTEANRLKSVIREAIQPPSAPSLAYAIGEVSNILSQSSYLKVILDGPNGHKQLIRPGRKDTGSELLEYRVPGVTTNWIPVFLDKDPNKKRLRLRESESQRIGDDVTQLDRLLKEPADNELESFVLGLLKTDSELVPDMLDPSVVTVISNDLSAWKVMPDLEGWTVETTVFMQFGSTRQKSVPINKVALEMRDRTLAVTDVRNALPEATRKKVFDALLELQNDSIKRLVGGDATKDLSEFLQVPSLELNDLQQLYELPIPTESAGLQPRMLSSNWKPKELEFDADNWTTQAEDIRFAAAVISELQKKRGGENDWISAGSIGRVSELSRPDPQNKWILGVPADWDASIYLPIPTRWKPDDDSAEQAADRILSSEKPDYWAMIEIRKEIEDPALIPTKHLISFVDCLANRAVDSSVSRYLNSDPLVIPRFEIEGDKSKLAYAVGEMLPNALEITFRSGWELGPDRVPNGIDANLLKQELEKLPQPVTGTPATGTLELTRQNGGDVRWTCSETDDLIKQLGAKLPRVQALQDRLAQFEERRKLESEINKKMIGAADGVIKLTGNDALLLLYKIWNIKNAGEGNVAKSQNLSGVISAATNSFKNPNLRHKVDPVKPTVFAEYFCGIQDTYAIVWSCTRAGQLKEGPNLVSLCPNTQYAVGGAELGDLLLKGVFDQVPEAINAIRSLDWKEQLGIILAPDDRASLFDLRNLSFQDLRTKLSPFNPVGGPPTHRITWNSLDDLLTKKDMKDYKVDYRLVPALSTPMTDWSSVSDNEETQETLRWAMATLDAAVSK